jgi:threonine dehydrogenase-like Zn-dependent dehydrogenase
MRAVVFDRELRVVSGHPAPRPGPGEALVRVRMAGICATDIEITKGYMGYKGVLGHEFVGTVEGAPGREDLVGKRVVGEIGAACGECAFCRSGMPTHCPRRTVLGIMGRPGAMADYTALPAGNLHIVPEGVPDEDAVFVEPLAAALEVLQQVHVRPSDRVLVMGDGRLGLLCALALSESGADVTLLGRHPGKLAIAGAAGVRTHTAETLGVGRDWGIVVEATGRPGGLAQALGLVRPRGTVVLKSTLAAGGELNLAPVVIDEIAVVGSRCGPFAPALRMLSSGRLRPGALVSAVYPAGRAIEAFAHAARPGTLKVLIDFRSGE